MPYKDPKDRKYKNAAKYEASPEQVKNRGARNAARAKLMKAGKVQQGRWQRRGPRQATVQGRH
jgi:hypothetical protein